ncbi:MAG: M16 family metallopeptidase [Syntrophorhabdus sp.]
MKSSKLQNLHLYLSLISLIFFLHFFPSFAFSLPLTERVTLQNGLRLIVAEDRSLPFVTFQLIIDGGSRLDPPDREGLSNMTAKGLLHGTTRHTAQQMSAMLDFIGAYLSTNSSKDYTSVGLKVLKKDLVQGFNLFIDALTQPLFPEDEFRREIQRTFGAIKSIEEDPGELSEREFSKTLFAKSPYAHPVTGTEQSLARLTRNDVASFHNTYIRPNRAILVIVGDVSLNEIKKDLMDRLETWSGRDVPEVSYEQLSNSKRQTWVIDRAITQANVVLGNLGPPRKNPDFFPIAVMNYILGGGFSSRLLTEVRAKRGFAYSVNSAFDFKKFTGSFSVNFQTKNDSAREAISTVLEEMKKIQTEPVTDKELEGARKYLTGSFPLRLDTQAKLAGFLAQVEFYDLGDDYADTYTSRIMAVTKEDIQRVAKKYLNPDNYTLVAVGNLKEVGFKE